MIKELELLKSKGFIPKISNVILSKSNKYKILTNFYIDISYEKDKNPWIFNEKILNYFNITIIFCFNELLYNVLKSNKTDWLYKDIASDTYSKNIDYVQIHKKLQSSFLNFNKNIVNNNIITGFTEDIEINVNKLDHFSIFVSVDIDKKQLANKFKISESKYTDILGCYIDDVFIKDSKIINNKLNDVTIPTEINTSNTSKYTLLDLQNIKTEFDQIPNKYIDNSLSYFSDLFYSINTKNTVIGYFNIDMVNIFKCFSLFKHFFNNKSFLMYFTSIPEDILIKHIKIQRIDDLNNSTCLYDGKYFDYIDTKECKISKNYMSSNNILYLSFIDKESYSLYKKYTYNVEIKLKDICIDFVNKMKIYLNTIREDLFKILNICNSPQSTNTIFNNFTEDFYKYLEYNDLSLYKILLNIYIIFSNFFEESSDIIQNIKIMLDNNFYNLDIIHYINKLFNIADEYINKLEKNIQYINSFDIIIYSNFKNTVDKTPSPLSIEIINNKDDLSIFDKNSLISRINAENKKYNNANVIIPNIPFLSPIIVENIDQKELKLDNMDIYNEKLIDLYYRKGNK